MSLKALGLALFIMLVSLEVRAQDFGNVFGCRPNDPGISANCGTAGVTPAPTSQAALPTDFVSLNRPGPNQELFSFYLPLSAFASSQSVMGLQSQFAQMQNQFAQMQNQIADFQKRSAELSAMAASFNITPPNPGDRFSLSFGAAGGPDGSGAGSVSGSYRVTNNTLLYAGYARGPTQNMGKGGFSMSFH